MKRDTSQTTLATPPPAEIDTKIVRDQLARVLASSAFRSSKRYPDFLRYTVERALAGETENMKERVLGVEVFGRDPSYDTSSDPVVRITAAEVRKRLEQYYRLNGHQSEVRIEFPRGSYVPEFNTPQPEDMADATSSQIGVPNGSAAKRWRIPVYVGALSAVLCACLWGALSARKSALDLFWAPVFNSQTPVLLCIPDITSPEARVGNPSPALLGPSTMQPQLPIAAQRDRVFFVDTFVATKVSAALAKKNRSFRLFHTEDATLDDLKQGPAVLIGGTNNPWINQVSSGLRFSLADDGTIRYISDRQNPSSRQWGINGNGWDPPSKVDYAVISRLFDTTTGQPIVIVAGARSMGTEAAGECLVDPQCFESATMLAPGDWRYSNIQIVVQAPVVNEAPGQPKVIAAYLWR